ncbi:ARF GTPase-activating protein GIT2 [Collichthys lucidus]|uniref:ARF GTPase-activating protein GIT2 n=1 Tax=Collichthys lucidus TaxID=240159 RepID=A0A4U5UY33_COLLU|nr:ARF GTPase-activating protein GIT2 [Collichthys lucidus]
MSKRLRNTELCADCSVPDESRSPQQLAWIALQYNCYQLLGVNIFRVWRCGIKFSSTCRGKEPRWASVNRGVLICDECCSVHRSLGRHSSQVRHLTHTPWPPTQLQMVQTLYSNGANSIWEHSLLDPASVTSGKRKANPQDKLHPNKSDFIRAKYQALMFVHRMPCREDDSSTAKDLSKEKGNTPLHVAAKAGQVSQAELLTVYGADPGAPDSNGKTPIDYAREAGHHELADRLVEVQYELTDRLAFYLCGRKPDHKTGQHFIVPQMADSSLDLSELAKAAKKKLQSLSNHLFEELAMDVYDEVDRRETDAVWLATQNHSTLVTETTVVPFLPVNPEYSSTRNQASQLHKSSCFDAFLFPAVHIYADGRQKLARFNAHEFATLVIDILSDAKRRQQGNSITSPKDNVEFILKSVAVRHCSDNQDNDQPDYDSVASDEDTDQELPSGKGDRTKSLDSDLSDSPITMHEYLEVKNALSASEAKIQHLMKANNNLSDELRLMQKKLQSLQSENTSLRRQVTTNIYQIPSGSDYPDPSSPSALKRRQSARASRPMSMYETGSGLKPYLPKGETPYPEEGIPTLQPFPPHASKLEKQSSMPESDYDNTFNESEMEDSGLGRRGRLRSSGWFGEGSSIPELDDLETESDPALPSTEDVIRKTEQITKNIQELLRAAQENKHDSFIPCSERIHVAVTEMAALFPKKPRSDTVRGSLRLLTSSAYRLQSECRKAVPSEGCPGPDMQLVTQQVIQCAYDIAKAAKQLVTITTKENTN